MEPGHARLAPTPPAYCSGCFQQKTHLQHVDMGAAWDGPTLPALDGAVGVVGHTIDDLILCADCVATAAALLGYARHDDLQDANTRLEHANAELHDRLSATLARIRELETLRDSDSELRRIFTPGAPPSSPRRRKVGA